MSVKRFGVSLDEEILKTLDKLVIEQNFPNRSQAIRHLIKHYDIQYQWKQNEIVTGAITLLYSHKERDIENHIADTQHSYPCLVQASQRVMLEQDMCFVSIIVSGKAERLIRMINKLNGIKGIENANLIMSSKE